MSKVFIAGGAGFIGSHLTRSFLDDGYEVYVFDGNIQYFYPMTRYSIKNMEYRHGTLLKGAELIRGSTLDVNDLRRKIYDIRPDYVINLAALPLAVTAVKNSEEAYSSILDATHNFMEVLRECSWVTKYVHISSSMIYGDFQEEPNPESALKEPKEIYGAMKLASEYVVKGYAQRYDINSALIRPSAVYGPTDSNYRVLQKFIEAAINGDQINANNPSGNKLDFSYVEDTAEGIKAITLADTPNMEAFNVTRGEGRTLKEVLEVLQKHFTELNVVTTGDTGFYPKRGALDISKARKIAGYDPKYSLEDGLEKLHKVSLRMKRLIIGMGSQARYVIDNFEEGSIFGLIDIETPVNLGKRINGVEVVGYLPEIEKFNVDEYEIIIAYGNNKAKREISERIETLGFRFFSSISSHTYIASHVKIGRGCIINPNVTVMPNVIIGDHVVVHSGCVVEHDNLIENFVNLAPGVITAGYVKINEGCTIYTGTNIIPKINIGSWSIIGAGSTVIKDIPDSCKAYGTPARILEKIQ